MTNMKSKSFSKKREINQTFQRLLIIIFIMFLLAFITSKNDIGTFGINKTVGWAWDLIPLNLAVFVSTSTIFLLMYFVLILLRIQTNRTFSVIQIVLIIAIALLYISIAMFYNPMGQFIIFILNLLSIIIFVFNLVWIVRNRKKRF